MGYAAGEVTSLFAQKCREQAFEITFHRQQLSLIRSLFKPFGINQHSSFLSTCSCGPPAKVHIVLWCRVIGPRTCQLKKQRMHAYGVQWVLSMRSVLVSEAVTGLTGAVRLIFNPYVWVGPNCCLPTSSPGRRQSAETEVCGLTSPIISLKSV